jgi:hypothetical protein
MDANKVERVEVVSASKKLGRKEAAELAKSASRVIVAKGKQVQSFEPGGKAPTEVVEAMLGPTGNLRAPTLRVGKTILVGFDEASFREVLR